MGRAALKRFRQSNIDCLGLARLDVDLLAENAADDLANILLASDALVVISAVAPCKTTSSLVENVTMMEAVCAAIKKVRVQHVIYISSDAVYADSHVPLTEVSCAEPNSLHGVMHLSREIMLKSVSGELPVAILRPSLLYGVDDPHNGYGPNRFRRLLAEGDEIVLFGDGEERRDHVHVDDVAEIIYRTAMLRSIGTLNVATGQVASFMEIAKMVASHYDAAPVIRSIPRPGPMPHNGYRAFDITACKKAFPDFNYIALEKGLEVVNRQMKDRG